MGKIPSDQHGMTTDVAVRVPPFPVYIAHERQASLSQVLVDFEAFLLDESGEQARYAYLREEADKRFDEEVTEQKHLQAEAALQEEKRRHEASALAEAMRRIQDNVERARNGQLFDSDESEEDSEEESERDSESFVSSPSSSGPSSSSGSDSEPVPFSPRQTKTSNLKSPRKPRQRSQPYPKRAPARTPTPTPAPKSRPEQFVEFFTQNKTGKKPALGENEYWVHGIDWANAPPTWDGKAIPAMAADDVPTWLKNTYQIYDENVCKMGECLHAKKKRVWTNLKAHLFSSKHLNLRRKCHACRFASRGDVFKERHKCRELQVKNAALIRRSPGPVVPSYTWKPSKV